MDGRPLLSPPTILHWSPDGRWLAMRWTSDTCGEEFLASADGVALVPATGAHGGAGILDAAWSPDGRWLALATFGEVAVLGVDPTGAIHDPRVVWHGKGSVPFGPAWSSTGALAFQVERDGAGMASVAVLEPGAVAPLMIAVPTGGLAPLAWTADGSALVAPGSRNGPGSLYVITRSGAHALDLGDVEPPGGKWLDVPVGIVGDRIVFAGQAPDSTSADVYSVTVDGTGLERLTTDRDGEGSLLLAPAPDGHTVAVSTGGRIDLFDLDDGTRQALSSDAGGFMDWQPVPVEPTDAAAP